MMAVKQNARKPQRSALIGRRVSYFDGDWNELEHLRIEEALPREILDAVERWLFEKDLLKIGKLSSSALSEAMSMSVGGADEED